MARLTKRGEPDPEFRPAIETIKNLGRKADLTVAEANQLSHAREVMDRLTNTEPYVPSLLDRTIPSDPPIGMRDFIALVADAVVERLLTDPRLHITKKEE